MTRFSSDPKKQTPRRSGCARPSRARATRTPRRSSATGLVFCADPRGEYFHLFVLSGAGADGEMKTRAYDYQDPANTDPWFEGDGSFGSVAEQLCEKVRDNALDG